MRFPIGVRGLVAAAAIAGGVVYWRASARRRAERLEVSIDDAIAAGRRIAETLEAPQYPSPPGGGSFGQE